MLVKSPRTERLLRPSLRDHVGVHVARREAGDAPTAEERNQVVSHDPDVVSAGRAPVVSPLVLLPHGQREQTLELVLTKGLPMDLIVQDSQGTPIPRATIKGQLVVYVGEDSRNLDAQTAQANDRGQLRLEHVGQAKYSLTVMAPGFQRRTLTKTFSAEKPFNASAPYAITMKAANPNLKAGLIGAKVLI